MNSGGNVQYFVQGPEGEGRTWGEPEALLVFDVKPHEDYYVKRATIVFGFVGAVLGAFFKSMLN